MSVRRHPRHSPPCTWSSSPGGISYHVPPRGHHQCTHHIYNQCLVLGHHFCLKCLFLWTRRHKQEKVRESSVRNVPQFEHCSYRKSFHFTMLSQDVVGWQFKTLCRHVRKESWRHKSAGSNGRGRRNQVENNKGSRPAGWGPQTQECWGPLPPTTSISPDCAPLSWPVWEESGEGPPHNHRRTAPSRPMISFVDEETKAQRENGSKLWFLNCFF